MSGRMTKLTNGNCGKAKGGQVEGHDCSHEHWALCVGSNNGCSSAVHTCPSGQKCVNSNGNFICEDSQPDCPQGFRKENNECLDINECREGVTSQSDSVSFDASKVCQKSAKKATWASAKQNCEAIGAELWCPKRQQEILKKFMLKL